MNNGFNFVTLLTLWTSEGYVVIISFLGVHTSFQKKLAQQCHDRAWWVTKFARLGFLFMQD